MKRILYVSGFSGFVGKNIFHYFFNDPFVKCAELNLREPLSGMAFAKQSAVLHLAGKAHDLRSTQDEGRTRERMSDDCRLQIKHTILNQTKKHKIIKTSHLNFLGS